MHIFNNIYFKLNNCHKLMMKIIRQDFMFWCGYVCTYTILILGRLLKWLFNFTVDKLSFDHSFMIWKTWLTFGRLRFDFNSVITLVIFHGRRSLLDIHWDLTEKLVMTLVLLKNSQKPNQIFSRVKSLFKRALQAQRLFVGLWQNSTCQGGQKWRQGEWWKYRRP